MLLRYDDYLEDLHSKMCLPDEILVDTLRETLRQEIVSKRRIVGGEINEVYEVDLGDGAEVIVRVSRDDTKHFEQEVWAIAECAKRGVPVPEVLGVVHLSTPGKPLDICVLRKIEGVLLPQAKLTPDLLERVVGQAGEYLSRIHEIPTQGFGYLDGQGKGEYDSIAAESEELRRIVPELNDLAGELGIGRGVMRRAIELATSEAGAEEADVAGRGGESRLTHNDFCSKHVFVEGHQISGIIDFGEVSAGEPVSDFVRWDYYDSERLPIDWLMAGYANKAVFDADFSRRLRVKRIAFGLFVLHWYSASGYKEGVADAKVKLLVDVSKMD